MTTEIYAGWNNVEPWGYDDIFKPGTTTRIEPRRLHDWCEACRDGDHSAHLGGATPTCKRAVDPVPWDFTCKCEETT